MKTTSVAISNNIFLHSHFLASMQYQQVLFENIFCWTVFCTHPHTCSKNNEMRFYIYQLHTIQIGYLSLETDLHFTNKDQA